METARIFDTHGFSIERSEEAREELMMEPIT
jgi:hypothetical protein